MEKKFCRLPSALPPEGLKVEQVPQFMSFAFDDNAYSGYEESGAVGGMKFIIDTFESFSNPKANGNAATFDGEKYKTTLYFKGNNAFPNKREDDALVKRIVREAYDRGHEIGCHTFTHPEGVKFNWDTEPAQRIDNLFYDDWMKELTQCIDVLTKPYNPDAKSGDTESGMGIPREDIVGFRTPFLDYNEHVYKALEDLGFKYDATIEEGWQDDQDGSDFLWPYTLDAGSPGDEYVAKNFYGKKEPFVGKHPGLWLLPEYVLVIPPDELCEKYGTKPGARKRAMEASDGDGESGKITGMDWNIWFQFFMDKADALATMKYSFDLRYDGNRCPFTFGMHTDIYSDKYDIYDLEGDEKDKIKATAKERREAVKEFLEYINSKPDTRVATAE
ncbi:MAG: polysaccharide deacetylase family protein, partial [Treponema sp.]|nr:polysaccharide deacetylase family protein [Treponema sp.]